MKHIRTHKGNGKAKRGESARNRRRQTQTSRVQFTYEGVEITDPTLDESGRFKVNPVGYYGEAYINAWQDAIVIELQNLIDEEIVGLFCLENTSGWNDPCRSLTIFVHDSDKGDSSIQIYTPNHPDASEEEEQFNTYCVMLEDADGNISYPLESEGNLTYVIDKIQELMVELENPDTESEEHTCEAETCRKFYWGDYNGGYCSSCSE